MAEYRSFEPRVEVSGEVVAAFVAGFPPEVRESGLAILDRHRIPPPRNGEFYSLQSLLDAMKEIGEIYSPGMLYRVGREIALHAKLPPDIDALEKCLASIDVAYHMNHRAGDIGHYHFSRVSGVSGGMNKVRIDCHNPYPCAFDLGCIEGFAERFKPPQCMGVVVRHDDSQPCRRHGGDACSFIVAWM